MIRIIIVVLSFLLLSSNVIAETEPTAASTKNLPGVVRATNRVFLIENNSTTYIVWHALNIKNATLVHLDTHDDCRYVSPEKIAALEKLTAKRDYAEIFRLSDLESSFKFRVKPDNFLYDLGNFIYPCIVDGTISTFYWVVSNKAISESERQRLQTHLQTALRLESPDFKNDDTGGGFRFKLLNATVIITTLDNLPQMGPGAVLDFDIDFFAFPHAMTDNHLTGALIWDPSDVCVRLNRLVPKPKAVTICSSVWGGYLPIMFRFIPDGCFEYFGSGRYPEYANELLNVATALRTSPGTIPALGPPENKSFESAYDYLKGLLLMLGGKDDEALDSLERAAGRLPEYGKGLLDASASFLYMNKPKRAHEVLDRFEKLAGCETSGSAAARVKVCLAEGNLDKADFLSRKLLDWDRQPSFLILRGGVLTQQNKFAEAEAIYKEILRSTPGDAKVYYNMGIVLSRQGKTSEAVRHYRMAAELRPDFAKAHDNLGYILLQEGQLDKAIEHLSSAVRLNPFNVTSLNNLGKALAGKGLFDVAAGYYLLALRANPNQAEIHANLADTFMKLGRSDDAAAHCREALRLKPGWQEVADLLRKAEKQGSVR